MMLEFDGEIARSPKLFSGWPSKIGVQKVPLLADFQMPPVADATYMVDGSRGSTSMSWMRPPVAAGPMERKCRASKGDCAESTAGRMANRKASRRGTSGGAGGRRSVSVVECVDWWGGW